MDQASEAMARAEWFEAERLALEALGRARRAMDFALMARICLPLQEARRNRLSLALDVGERRGVHVRSTTISEEAVPEPGCWLVTPPLVGADARRLRLAGLGHAVPLAVLCREPTTRAGRWPVVAVGPVVIRVHIQPPPECPAAALDAVPPLAWFTAALEALGDVAIAAVAEELDATRRVDGLLERLDSHPDHEKLHQALAAACREAHAAQARPRSGGRRTSSQRPDAGTTETISGDEE